MRTETPPTLRLTVPQVQRVMLASHARGIGTKLEGFCE
jgi:hypothetical protein